MDPGLVWSAADVQTCVGSTPGEGAYVSRRSWRLVFSDNTQADPSSEGYNSFPRPEFPWAEQRVSANQCIRGWITFPVLRGARPVAVAYGNESVAPREWALR